MNRGLRKGMPPVTFHIVNTTQQSSRQGDTNKTSKACSEPASQMSNLKGTSPKPTITSWDLHPEDQNPIDLEISSASTLSRKGSESQGVPTAKRTRTYSAIAFPTNHIHLIHVSGADWDNIDNFIERVELVFKPQALLYSTAKQKAVKLKMLTLNLPGKVEDYYRTLDKEDHYFWDKVTEHLLLE